MLAEFSGYIAADELYDGPFCVLSIVDNRTFRRISAAMMQPQIGPMPGALRNSSVSGAKRCDRAASMMA